MNHSRIDPAAIVSSPDWLLAGIDPDAEQLSFARVSRDTYLDSSFLDHRIRPLPEQVQSLSLAQTMELLNKAPPAPPAGYILHSAFTGSTLLAACLNQPGRALVLKEPLVLSRLAGYYRAWRAAGELDQRTDLIDTVIHLLERRYQQSEPVLIKPSNYANALSRKILDLAPRRPVLLMVDSLRRFLISNLKKSDESRQQIPQFLNAFLQDGNYQEKISGLDWGALDWLRQCVVVWHCQLAGFQTLLENPDYPQLRSVDMRHWLARPLDALQACSELFGISLSKAECRTIIEQGPFQRHSKDQGVNFSSSQYQAESQQIESAHKKQLEQALDWYDSTLAIRLAVELPLPRPLLTDLP